MANDRPIVFLGPSLTREEAQSILPDVLLLPPIRRAALDQFLANPPALIGIIDGVFCQDLAISPKEILTLLKAGSRIFGASSMGALRAVELSNHGMVGVGEIFHLYRSGRLLADDEVAMTLCPETLRPLSEPLVNIRLALKAAARTGIVDTREAAYIVRCLKRLYFPERTLSRMFAFAGRILVPDRLCALRSWWSASAPNAKEDDARELLRRIAELRSNPTA